MRTPSKLARLYEATESIVTIDKGSAPRLLFSGEDLLLEDLPVGTKVTVALDDISLPLPPMRTPDVRQQVLEVILPLLADSGVDDVHLVIAICLHRRMTESEMRRMVGDRIFEDFYP